MWSQIPEELLQPICAALQGLKAWSCWQADLQVPVDFLALRGACRRIAEGSARELKELDLTQKGSGLDPYKLGRVLRLVTDERFPRIGRVCFMVEDADGFRVLEEAPSASRRSSLDLRVTLAPTTRLLAFLDSEPLSPCRSIRGLRVVSSMLFTDGMLRKVLSLCPTLQELDVRRSEGLRRPELSDAVQGSLRRLFVDGCWQLEDDVVEALASLHLSRQCVVDWFRSAEGLGLGVGQHLQDGPSTSTANTDSVVVVWQMGQEVEVVILSEGYRGQWVTANIVSAVVFAGHSALEPCFNILVQKTEAFSQAVGFSGRVAFRIRRRHLRAKERSEGHQ
ncbi:CP2 [Symbiodinium natans]|uniref:CP2 protein n=1 Tax=Symbiodinium natans TaxID=878477 RepID=A0A812KL95_9DINO|nr:CP2 [Symbiodinium natans]